MVAIDESSTIRIKIYIWNHSNSLDINSKLFFKNQCKSYVFEETTEYFIKFFEFSLICFCNFIKYMQ